ncbi:MAG: 4-(cytidine 5'-diphospho)-2-C-methyl-D-erythritol kinase [Pseudomonadota bacterium]|nr:4-(cytidine 5'-diphospho)-2-C-methyl-D-erythritol kinase [Pseudomonadota bacterium]
MQTLYDVPAPAKLNLFLHITGRRPDGYHLLQSVFMLIDWCDILHLEVRPDGVCSREDLSERLPANDLSLRAARALQAATGCAMGVHIAVNKRIPAQAGMGGGSSDAASVLLALNRLWRLGLSARQLVHIGLGLGADVPFFLCGQHAWVEGIGEHITPITLPPARFVVVKPPQGLDTAKIFCDPYLKRDDERAILSGFAAHPYDFGRNTLQPVAERLCPEVGQAVMLLAKHQLFGRMTGSGSAVFARLSGQDDVPEALPDWRVRVCGNLDVHPLFGWASSDD